MRVLVIAHNSFSRTSNNGKTLESILSMFREDELAQLYFSNNEVPDFDFCERYFQVTDLDVLRSLVTFSNVCGKPIAISGGGNEGAVSKKIFPLLKKAFRRSKFIRDILWLSNKWKSKQLLSWVGGFRPDCIFFLGGDAVFSHRIVHWLTSELRIPLVSYFTDDYVIYSGRRGIASKFNRWVLLSAYQKTIGMSDLLYVIGERMAGEYSRFFNRKFGAIMNSVDWLDYQPPQFDEVLLISYFGGLHLNRWRMLVRFAELLPPGCILRVFTSSEISEEIAVQFANVGIVFKGFLASDELPGAMSKSHALLHVESDDAENAALTRLSVSTKIPEYLISGRAVIGFGPAELASMQLLVDEKIGIFIDSFAPLEVQKEWLGAHLRSNILVDIGLSGYRYAARRMLRSDIAQSFRSDLELMLKGEKC